MEQSRPEYRSVHSQVLLEVQAPCPEHRLGQLASAGRCRSISRHRARIHTNKPTRIISYLCNRGPQSNYMLSATWFAKQRPHSMHIDFVLG